jgi:voltage-gated potassium channel Kch
MALAALAAAEILVFAGIFTGTDHISYGTALYFAVETATTVGYGDVTPHSASGHVTAVIMMLTVIPTLGALFGRAAAVHTVRAWHRQHGAALDSAAKAHQIAADLFEASTGAVHPDAPEAK